jgi:hypothetical protein
VLPDGGFTLDEARLGTGDIIIVQRPAPACVLAYLSLSCVVLILICVSLSLSLSLGRCG